MPDESPKISLWNYYRKVWRKARDLEDKTWVRFAGPQVMLPIIALVVFSTMWYGATGVSRLAEWVDEERTGFILLGIGLVVVWLLRMLWFLVTSPVVLDVECNQRTQDASDAFEAERHEHMALKRGLEDASHARQEEESNRLKMLSVMENGESLWQESLTPDTYDDWESRVREWIAGAEADVKTISGELEFRKFGRCHEGKGMTTPGHALGAKKHHVEYLRRLRHCIEFIRQKFGLE